MRATLTPLLAALLLGTAFPAAPESPPAQPAPSAVELLLRTARYWQSRGREDRAVEAWIKVLRSDPNDPEALAALGSHHARAGRSAEARELLSRLQKAHPTHAEVANLARAIGVGKDFDTLLLEARAAGKAGKPDEALAKYRKMFGDLPPPRQLALEFYTTVGGTKEGWPEAKEGLAGLVAQVPGEPLYRLALARHLTYREETRREGIALLQKLESDPRVGGDASAALQKAIVWLKVGPQDDTLLKQHLARHPQDESTAKRRAELHKAPGRSPLLALAFAALKRGEVREAERQFEAAAKSAGSEGDAYAGLGLVAMQKQDYAKAQGFFERSRIAAPDRPEVWEKPLRSAGFFALYHKAQAAAAAGKLDEAEGLLQQAARASTDEASVAEVALGELFLQQGDIERAEARLRKVLQSKRDDPGALRALVQVLLQSGRGEEAEKVNERLRAIDAERAYKPGWVEAERRRAAATQLKKEKRLEAARAQLLAARDADPEHVWVLHDLADFHVLMGETAQARLVVARLVQLAPDLPAARIVQARQLAAEGETLRALDALKALPDQSLDEEVRSLRRKLQFQAEVDHVVRRALRGRREVARQELMAIQERVHDQAEKQAIVGMGWAALAEHSRAVALLNEAAESEDKPPPGIRLQLASVLLKSGRDAQLGALLVSMHNDPGLNPREMRDLTSLRVAHAVRRADRFRGEGEYPLAYAQLSGLLVERPEDPRLLCALGRLFGGAGRPEEAQAIFTRLVTEDPDDLEARQGAVDSSLALREEGAARKVLDEALRRAPQDPRIHLLAGRFAVRVGRDGEAMERFRHAQALIEAAAAEAPLQRGGLDPIDPDGSTATVLRQAARMFAPKETAGRDPSFLAEGSAIQLEIKDEMEQVRARHTVDVSIGTEMRRREGIDGLGAINEFRFPVELNVPLGYSGRFSLRVTPVSADAGTLDFTSPLTSDLFGTGAQANAFSARRERGTEVRLGYAQGGFTADVGSTPLGFDTRNVVGGVSFRGELGPVGLSAEASRRSVTDSLLSYAGQRDPISGELWGGVLRNAGRVDLAFLAPMTTYYVSAGYHFYNGTNVQKNRAVVGGAGIEWKLYDHGGTGIVTGLSFGAESYEHNERSFTLGHGGYFSPASFVRAGIPFQVRSTAGKLRWDLAANVGVNWFREARALYFPLDGDRQAAREAAVDKNGDPLAAVYNERTNLSFALSTRARLTYAVTDQLEGGVSFDLHRADDFQEVTAGLFLRFSFRGKVQPGASAGLSPLEGPEAAPRGGPR